MEPLPTGTRLTESYDAERPLAAAMAWLTQKWVGGSNRDDDLREGMHVTLQRIKGVQLGIDVIPRRRIGLHRPGDETSTGTRCRVPVSSEPRSRSRWVPGATVATGRWEADGDARPERLTCETFETGAVGGFGGGTGMSRRRDCRMVVREPIDARGPIRLPCS